MIRTRQIAISAALVALAACGDDSTGPRTPADMTGTWTSNGNLSTGEAFVFTMTLTSADANVTGTAQVTGLASGNITGTVAGNKLTFQWTLTQPCAATLSGTATVNGRNLSGSMGGTAQCLGTVQATFAGAKLLLP